MKHSTRGDIRTVAGFFLLLFLSGISYSQEIPEIPWSRLLIPGILLPEDPATLFDYTTEDAEVDFLISGSWKTTVALGGGFRLQPVSLGPSLVWGSKQSQFSPSPFENNAHLLSSIWIEQQYFISTEIIDAAEARSLLVGYRGSENDILQSAVIGYGPFLFPAYTGISADTGFESIPAVMVHLQGDEWENHSRISVHQGEWEDRYYSQAGEIQAEIFSISDPLEPFEFVLPDSGIDAVNLEIWIEDSNGSIQARPEDANYSGDSLQLRPAVSGVDYTYQSSSGKLEFFSNEQAILVRYNSGASSTGDAGLGIDSIFDIFSQGWPENDSTTAPVAFDFTWGGADWLSYLSTLGLREAQFRFEVDTGGGWEAEHALLLHRPGRFSPFGRYNRFVLPGRVPDEQEYLLSISPGSTPLQLEAQGIEDTLVLQWHGQDARSVYWRYPLFWFPDSLHGRSHPILPQVQLFPLENSGEIQNMSEFTLPADTSENSLQVSRNGTTTSWDYDASSNTLRVFPPLLPGETLHIRYFRLNGENDPVLHARSGTRGTIGNSIDWNISQQGMWGFSLPNQSEITSSASLPRSARVSASIGQETQSMSWNVQTNLRVQSIQPNENNDFLSWNGEYSLSPPAQGVRISAPPERIYTRDSVLTPITISDLGHDTRGELHYRLSPQLNGTSISYQDFNQEIAQIIDQAYSSSTNGKAGPYLAYPRINGSPANSPHIIMEYALQQSSHWVGSEVRSARISDFRDADSLNIPIYWRSLETGSPDVQIIIQLGSFSEDADDDNAIDSSPNGIPFTTDDGRQLFTSYHGALANIAAGYFDISEDWDNNGELSTGSRPEDVYRDLSINITDQLSDGNWTDVNIDFSELPVSARQQLDQADTMRVFVLMAQPSGNTSQGILCVGDISWHENSITSLESTNNDASLSYNSTSIELTASETVDISGPIRATGSEYAAQVVFPLRGDSEIGAATVNGTIFLYSESGQEIYETFSLLPNQEKNIHISLDQLDSALVSYHIQCTGPAAPDYSILIGQPYLSGANSFASSVTKAEFSLHLPDRTIAGPLHSPRVQGQVQLYLQNAMAGGSGNSLSHTVEAQAEGSTGIGPVFLNSAIAARQTGEQQSSLLQLSHALAFPYSNTAVGELQIPTLETTAARSPASTAIMSQNAGLHLLDYYQNAEESLGKRRRFLGIWGQLSSEVFAPSFFFGSDSIISRQDTDYIAEQSLQLYAGFGPSENPIFGISSFFEQETDTIESLFAQTASGYNYPTDTLLLFPREDINPRQRRSIINLESSLGEQGHWRYSFELEAEQETEKGIGAIESLFSETSSTNGTASVYSPTIGDAEIEISYSISRNLTIQNDLQASPQEFGWRAWTEDMTSFFSQANEYTEYLTAIPFAALFPSYSSPISRNQQESLARISYGHRLQLERRPSAGLVDLFVPQLIQIDVERDSVDIPGEQDDSIALQTVLRSRAVNLFGRFGNHTLFQWYDIDSMLAASIFRFEYPTKVLTIQPSCFIHLEQNNILSVDLNAQIQSEWDMEEYQHNWRIQINNSIKKERYIETGWNFLSEGQLSHGPGIGIDVSSAEYSSVNIYTAHYGIEIFQEDKALLGIEIQAGIQQESAEGYNSSLYDIGAAIKIYGEMYW